MIRYEQLVKLAKEVAGLAIEARIIGEDAAAWDLVSASGTLETAAFEMLEEEKEEEREE